MSFGTYLQSPSNVVGVRGKNSLTFESIVCSQMELQRRATMFSHRRQTTCRRPSVFPLTSSISSRTSLAVPNSLHSSSIFSPSCRTLSSTRSDSTQQLRTNSSLHARKSSQSSSVNSARLANLSDRQSFVSMFLFDPTIRSLNSAHNQRRHGRRRRRWSYEDHKSSPFYWTLRCRLVEEYAESESLIEFTKKTFFVLTKTREATIFLCFFLLLPLLMMTTGVSHLDDCPRQDHLPIYLFVGGTVWIAKLLQKIWQKYRMEQKKLIEDEPSSDPHDGQVFIDGVMTSFLIIWFFCGQYWLISLGYPPQFHQSLHNPDMWCDKSVVYCSFASFVIIYSLAFLFLFLLSFLVLFTRHTVIQTHNN